MNAVEQGHFHGTEAEQCLEIGDIEGAINAHYLAAEAYLQAINDATDPEVVKTLKLLYTNHTRQGRELTRKKVQRTPPDAETIEAVSEVEPHSEASSAQSLKGSSSNIYVAHKGKEHDVQKSVNETFDHFWDNVELLAHQMPIAVPGPTSPLARSSNTSDSSSIYTLQSNSIGVVKAHYRTSSPVHVDIEDRLIQPVSGFKKTLEEYREENEQLKKTIDELSLRLDELEKENSLLRRALLRLKGS